MPRSILEYLNEQTVLPNKNTQKPINKQVIKPKIPVNKPIIKSVTPVVKPKKETPIIDTSTDFDTNIDSNTEEKSSILSRVGGHLRDHWKKYALGAGIVGAGLLTANPAWFAKAGTVAGGAIQKAGTVAGNAVQRAGVGVANNLTKARGFIANNAYRIARVGLTYDQQKRNN
jgi:hypothetical protein